MTQQMSDWPAIRAARFYEVGKVAGTLADAFQDGDLAEWLVPDEASRRKIYPEYFRIFAEYFIPPRRRGGHRRPGGRGRVVAGRRATRPGHPALRRTPRPGHRRRGRPVHHHGHGHAQPPSAQAAAPLPGVGGRSTGPATRGPRRSAAASPPPAPRPRRAPRLPGSHRTTQPPALPALRLPANPDAAHSRRP